MIIIDKLSTHFFSIARQAITVPPSLIDSRDTPSSAPKWRQPCSFYQVCHILQWGTTPVMRGVNVMPGTRLARSLTSGVRFGNTVLHSSIE